jgi:SOS regulatory protein LexA
MQTAERTMETIRIEVAPGRQIGLLGAVAAGVPLEAVPVEETVAIPPAMWAGKKVFALRVRGASMVDEGIRDGDHLIVEPRDGADDGQTVVAEVDGGVTVKRLFREPGGAIRLQPANPEMLPLVIPGKRVRVLGVVVGVLRRQGFAGGRRAASVARPSRSSDGQTLDLTVRAIGQSLREAEELAARKTLRPAARIRELGRALRSLRDCYVATTSPRLRQALLREAGDLMRRLRRFGIEPRGEQR